MGSATWPYSDISHLCPKRRTELCAISSELGGVSRDVHLRAGATESGVKPLSSEGTLANARVVQFATHGLLADETSRVANALDEPALLLTPPTAPTKEDDGLLTASEVSQLKLNADWVVLSACNTAGGGDDKNSEALSGLAKAFFYGGARALLVSHWYVDSRAAVKITTSAFAELERNPQIGRAEAFRRAMLATMNDAGRPKSWTPAARPAVWAPFVLVGEGGVSQVNSATATDVRAPPPLSQAKLAPSGRKTSNRHLRTMRNIQAIWGLGLAGELLSSVVSAGTKCGWQTLRHRDSSHEH